MGARRFSPDAASLLQPDSYQGALSNLGLSMDPLTGNRYSLAAGNPVGFVEVDGHKLASIGPGNADIPNGPQSGDPKLPDAGSPPSQVDGAGWKDLIGRTESHGVNGRLQPQCYNYPGTVSGARKLASRCFEPTLGAAALNHPFWDMTGTGYNTGWEPPSELEQMIAEELILSLIPVGRAANLVGRGAKAASHVLMDTSAARSLKQVSTLLKQGECPVICSTVQRELAGQGRTSGLSVIADGTSATLQSQVAGNLRAFGGAARGFEGDAIIGATALEHGIPLITGDQDVYNAVSKLGGDARLFTPGGGP